MNPLLLDLAALYHYLNTAAPWTADPDYVFITDAELQPTPIPVFMAQREQAEREQSRAWLAGRPGRREPSEEEIAGSWLNYIYCDEILSMGE